ncbi:tripartite ATP-independent transporter solute receptor, DctP family [Geosporobacter subterraneus DSM 17957]|uniref:Tripartite ATP-independent transporter solute receptor, DctP family n=1 Tax=Geosporobacter subterraneus DSM 17957 TaxID=1121919 RepID=A0A1M6HZZ4_9FIRM|nr:TRAP transporter substrate-binding protein [Geosporobacter subterraneus]SHJ27711.1 tripartite ATP-independent transporter solute receptor, DctP family [Geosporobacter subterraneus DSM 17957]
MKKLLSLVLILVMLFAVGCSTKSNNVDSTNKGTEIKQGEFKIKVGLVTPEQDIATRSMRHFEEQVEKLSEGRIDVEVFPGGALGGSADIFNGVQDGSIEMCVNIYPPFAQFSDAFLLYNLPYLFSSKEAAFEFLDSDIAKNIAKSIENKGFKQLAVFDGGFRNVSNNKGPVKNPNDLRGLKIRTLDNPIQIDYFKAYGANPTPLPYGDIYVGLQTKTIDGQENSFSNAASMKFNEVQKYFTDTKHAFDPAGMFINTGVFNSYPDDVKQIIEEAALSTQKFNRELAVELENQSIETIKKTSEIYYLTNEERQVFIDMSMPTYKNFEQKIGKELMDSALAKIKEIESK